MEEKKPNNSCCIVSVIVFILLAVWVGGCLGSDSNAPKDQAALEAEVTSYGSTVMQLGGELVTNVSFKDNYMTMIVTVNNMWFEAPEYSRKQLLRQMNDSYAGAIQRGTGDGDNALVRVEDYTGRVVGRASRIQEVIY